MSFGYHIEFFSSFFLFIQLTTSVSYSARLMDTLSSTQCQQKSLMAQLVMIIQPIYVFRGNAEYGTVCINVVISFITYFLLVYSCYYYSFDTDKSNTYILHS